MPPKGSVVYFIVGAGATKIGTTADVEARLRGLQASSPVPLRISWAVHGGVALERALHHMLRDRRMHGEWFKGAIEAAEAQTLVNQLQRTSRGWVPRTIPAARKDVDSSVPKYLDRTYRHIGTICKFCHDIPDVNVSCPSSDDGSHRRQIAVELIDPDRALPLPRGRFAVTDPALLQKIKQAYGK